MVLINPSPTPTSLGYSYSTPSETPNLSRRTSASALLQVARTDDFFVCHTELASYLDSDNVQTFNDDFNLLNWQHEHKLSYHILSILVKDVLNVHMSTIS